ncbi:hypothetical protein NDU88_007754 [Pleurodeles waltl]|uniref:Uncharacterized protein n=1 Tax=Pleurodeles waltl TaxID=8319 RepID=A0AAV7VQL2_PLEWA|nr:hypothetical protein NDU88_007754 [Pleurodeles waltl]
MQLIEPSRKNSATRGLKSRKSCSPTMRQNNQVHPRVFLSSYRGLYTSLTWTPWKAKLKVVGPRIEEGPPPPMPTAGPSVMDL